MTPEKGPGAKLANPPTTYIGSKRSRRIYPLIPRTLVSLYEYIDFHRAALRRVHGRLHAIPGAEASAQAEGAR